MGVWTNYHQSRLGCVIGLVALASFAYGAVALYGTLQILTRQPDDIWRMAKWGTIGAGATALGVLLTLIAWRRCTDPDDPKI